MEKRITLTAKERMVLAYLLTSVKNDLEWCEDTDDWRDCGGIIACLEKDEFEAMQNIMKKIGF